MKRIRVARVALVALVALLALVLISPAFAQLKEGDRVAITGDSITEQKQYSVFIQDYFLMCKPKPNLSAIQFGWGGETSWGFLARMKNDALPFQPTVATTCYGMNDGGYSPMTEDKAKRYRDATRGIVKTFKEAGVRFIVVGSPGVVDSTKFRRGENPAAAEMYNKTLGELRNIAREVATEEGVSFADVYGAMMEAMPKAKAKFGDDYAFAGGDGVHPGPNGHLVMAYAFLKALGCDGDIGTITLDLGTGQAEASEGHTLVSAAPGRVEVESGKYPFCFTGKSGGGDAGATIDTAQMIPFNEELNRFKLVVKGVPASAQRLRVTWGETSKEFATADLTAGVNLAAAFPEGNPFALSFKRGEDAIRAQQNFETPLVKRLINAVPQYKEMLPEEAATLDKLVEAGRAKRDKLAAAAKAAVEPVRHTIKVEVVN
jgi:lysophospholipase L1-like esterase